MKTIALIAALLTSNANAVDSISFAEGEYLVTVKTASFIDLDQSGRVQFTFDLSLSGTDQGSTVTQYNCNSNKLRISEDAGASFGRWKKAKKGSIERAAGSFVCDNIYDAIEDKPAQADRLHRLEVARGAE